MTTEIFFELQRRRTRPIDGSKTNWITDFKSKKFTETLHEYDLYTRDNYKTEDLQIVQVIRTTTVILPDQLLRGDLK